jgi:integrase
MGVETWIDKANGRLKGCKIKLHVPKGSDRIYLRGTFPAQPWEEDQRRRQRKIATGRRAIGEADVRVAEKLARQIDVDLNNGEFDWAGFGKEDPNPESESTTLAHWVRVFAESKQRDVEPLTWERNYAVVMRSLPFDKELSESILIDWILTQNPTGNTMRAKYIAIALGLCDVAGIPPGNIPKLRKGISNKPINVRNLPEPEVIEKIFLSIEKREWRWVFGMIATYGLRPHEIFRLDLSEFPDVNVLENSKTGARSITPLRPNWVDLFGLTAEIKIPDNIQWLPGMPNTRLGRKITNGYRRYGLGDAYDYRHCFARDCLVMGLSSDVSAKLMGHSREVHEKTYRRHIRAGVYLDAAKAAIAKHLL